MSAARPTLFLHVGTRKSGTSFLQVSMRKSSQTLLDQGVAQPFVDWPDHNDSLGLPLLACLGDDQQAKEARATLRASARRCLDAGTPRSVASFERLAELDTERIGVLAEAFSDLHLQVIVTARHWGAALPSEWQQEVKERYVYTPFPDFLEAVRTRSGRDAEMFRLRQDVADIASRWGSVIGDDRVTILPLPATMNDPDLLPQLFFGLLGVDPATVSKPRRSVNKSLSYTASETLRRVNLDLRDGMPAFTEQLRQFAYRSCLRSTLAGHDGRPAAVPLDHRRWVEEESRRQADELRAGPWRIVGDLDDLIPTKWPDEVPAPTEDEVAALSVKLAADLALRLVSDVEPPETTRAAAPSRGSLPSGGIRKLIRRR